MMFTNEQISRCHGLLIAVCIGLAACVGPTSKTVDFVAVVPDEDEIGGSNGLVCEIASKRDAFQNSLTQLVGRGLARAENEFIVTTQIVAESSKDEASLQVKNLVDAGCGIIIFDGSTFLQVASDAAIANPGTQFAIVDASTNLPNLYGLVFAADQAAFLAGYVAASESKTGIVATFGANKDFYITSSMTGFVRGVEYFNVRNGGEVRALGWNVIEQDGDFVVKDDSVSGANMAKQFINDGADVIFPVSAMSVFGVLSVAIESAGRLKVIGFAVDLSIANPSSKGVYLGTVRKRFDNAVFEAVHLMLDKMIGGVNYVGTLENDGVGFEASFIMSQKFEAEIEVLKLAIVEGSVTW